MCHCVYFIVSKLINFVYNLRQAAGSVVFCSCPSEQTAPNNKTKATAKDILLRQLILVKCKTEERKQKHFKIMFVLKEITSQTD